MNKLIRMLTWPFRAAWRGMGSAIQEKREYVERPRV